MADVTIERLTQATPESAEQLAGLMNQLSSKPEPLNMTRLERILGGDTAVYVARVDGAIVGSVSRSDMRHPVRTSSWIDDLVVDENSRGMGIAGRLMQLAISDAPDDVVTIGLSSKIERVESHRLYTKLGFQVREDNRMWRLSLK